MALKTSWGPVECFLKNGVHMFVFAWNFGNDLQEMAE